MHSIFTKIPAFNHFKLVDICSQIVNIWPGWFIDIHFFFKNALFTAYLLELFGVFPRRNWRVLEVRCQIVYGRCARRMRSRIEVGVLKQANSYKAGTLRAIKILELSIDWPQSLMSIFFSKTDYLSKIAIYKLYLEVEVLGLDITKFDYQRG